MKGKEENNMEEKKSSGRNNNVTAHSYCSPIRSCCLHKGCLGTFVHLTGSTWILDRCGCNGGGDVIA